jgi:hypothetical protein
MALCLGGAAGGVFVVPGAGSGCACTDPAINAAAAKRIMESFVIDFISFAVIAMLIVHKLEHEE